MANTLSPELMYRHCWDATNVVNDLAYAVQVRSGIALRNDHV